MTWSYSTGCVGDEGLSWMYQWDGESRGVFTSLTEDRHKKVVLVNTEVGTCTGVMVGPRDVLTAAHCVTDQDDPDVVVEVNAICSRGNSYTDADCVSRAHTSNIFEVTLNTSWTGGFANPSWDFALIEWASVSSPEDPDVLTGVPSSPMPISTMSNSEIEATTVRMYGHPAFLWDGSCQSQEDTSPVDTTMGMDGSYMAYEARTDHSVSSSRIKTNIDSNGGESGSPLHACPTGCSTGGEELVGLMTGWVNVGLDKYTGGPKAAQFADFVNDNL